MSHAIGFIPASTFVPNQKLYRKLQSRRPSLCLSSWHKHAPCMVGQRPSKREELERLTKQLAELQALREQLAKKRSSASSKSQPPSVSPPAAAPVSSPKEPTAATPTKKSKIESASTIKFGKSSQGSRFLSISSVDPEELYPRILLIAGALPGLSTEEFMNTPSMLYSKKPVQGNLFLSRMPDGFEGNMVALPGVDVLANCGDPVVVLVPPALISQSKLPSTPGDDIVLVIDRAMEEEFDSYAFYAWDVKGQVSIGWLNKEPPADEATRIGRVVYGVIEIDENLREKKTCWEEENETYQ